MKIGILGRGRFGSAIASLLQFNGQEFEVIDVGEHFSEKIDLVFLAVPVQLMKRAIEERKNSFSKNTVFVNCSKGVERESLMFPHQIIEKVLGKVEYCSLLGPSFAEEILEKKPTVFNLGCLDEDVAHNIRKIISTPYLFVQEVFFYKSLELSSAMKNVYAIACGFSKGLDMGDNTSALLITEALKEFELLANAIGFDYQTLSLPAIVGDLVLTCSSPKSRNYSFGLSLAKGEINEPSSGGTVEGFHTVESLIGLAKKNKVELALGNTIKLMIEEPRKSRRIFENYLISL